MKIVSFKLILSFLHNLECNLLSSNEFSNKKCFLPKDLPWILRSNIGKLKPLFHGILSGQFYNSWMKLQVCVFHLFSIATLQMTFRFFKKTFSCHFFYFQIILLHPKFYDKFDLKFWSASAFYYFSSFIYWLW